MAAVPAYPVRLQATLDPKLSRWLWLVKWFLAIPHFIVLAFLWVAFAVLSVIAFFGILFTGHYPRGIFEFNVGVLRWSWRVGFYTYSALGTDRYPPFTLAEVSEYPTHLDIAYPDHLSRGLVLVKWWLLAIPHYIVVGLFMGGAWFAWQEGSARAGSGGLIGLLVLIAAIALLFTGRYPQPLFDFVLGLNRWVLRVAAYAGLMTDEYPPFRLDMGGDEPAGTLTVSPPQPPAPPEGKGGWTAGRVGAVVAGALLVLVSLGLLGGGGTALWADQTQREGGYLTSATHSFRTDAYALASDRIDLSADGPDWLYSELIGDVRVRVTPLQQDAGPLFVGVARTADARTFLAGASYDRVRDLTSSGPHYQRQGGSAAPVPPASSDIWVAQASGTGQQQVVWPSESGDWTVVVMNADATPGLGIRADVGATTPALTGVAAGLLAAGAVLLLGGIALMALGVSRASR